MNPNFRITEAEWTIMEVVWKRHPAAAAEIIAALEGETLWAPNTIRTLLARLVKKGALACEPDGSRHLYSPLVSRGECTQDALDSLLQRVFGGAANALLVHFVGTQKLSKREIRELKKLLDEKEKEAVK